MDRGGTVHLATVNKCRIQTLRPIRTLPHTKSLRDPHQPQAPRRFLLTYNTIFKAGDQYNHFPVTLEDAAISR